MRRLEAEHIADLRLLGVKNCGHESNESREELSDCVKDGLNIDAAEIDVFHCVFTSVKRLMIC